MGFLVTVDLAFKTLLINFVCWHKLSNYLVEVEMLDDVDTDEDVDTELDVDTLQMHYMYINLSVC